MRNILRSGALALAAFTTSLASAQDSLDPADLRARFPGAAHLIPGAEAPGPEHPRVAAERALAQRKRAFALEFGARYGDGVSMRLDDVRLRQRLNGARADAKRAPFADGAVYADVLADTDAIVGALEGGFEELLHLGEDAPAQFEYQFTLTGDGAFVLENEALSVSIDGAPGARLAPVRYWRSGSNEPARTPLLAFEQVDARSVRMTVTLQPEDRGRELLLDPAWSAVAPMATARFGHTMTVLQDGRVLVVGGRDLTTPGFASCELFDPATDTWSAAASLNIARSWHTANLLADGRVLIAGGVRTGGSATRKCEVFDTTGAVLGTWSFTSSMNFRRSFHTATPIPPSSSTGAGRVLVAGGSRSTSGSGSWSLDTTEIYDMVTGNWTLSGVMNDPRDGHVAVGLPDGDVFIVGGYDDNGSHATAERWDLASQTWSDATRAGAFARERGTATLIPSMDLSCLFGTGFENEPAVLITGKVHPGPTNEWAEPVLYLPNSTASNPYLFAWKGFLAPLKYVRQAHTATTLPDGRILIAGGEGRLTAVSSPPMVWAIPEAEIFDPRSICDNAFNDWIVTGSMVDPRENHEALALPDGRTLVTGGKVVGTPPTVFASAEVYQ